MKLMLLSSILLLSTFASQAQSAPLNNLPAGKYETEFMSSHGKWERGDIILLDDKHYKVSTSDDVGDYRFSITAQRIFFTSGPLKTVFAKITTESNDPAIVIPRAENEQKGLKIGDADVLGVRRKEK